MNPESSLTILADEVSVCRLCPRLVKYREKVAFEKRRMFRAWTYWGRGVPGFGDPTAKLFILGLAPATHGANRTGRVFTGDRSGDFLYKTLHQAGFANQPTSVRRGDGLALEGVLVSAAVRCAPPDNRPRPEEFEACREYLDREYRALARLRVLVALGGLAFASCLAVLSRAGEPVPRPKPRFRHGGSWEIGKIRLFATYHPSQQNTFTGRLTPKMLADVLRQAAAAAAETPATS